MGSEVRKLTFKKGFKVVVKSPDTLLLDVLSVKGGEAVVAVSAPPGRVPWTEPSPDLQAFYLTTRAKTA